MVKSMGDIIMAQGDSQLHLLLSLTFLAQYKTGRTPGCALAPVNVL